MPGGDGTEKKPGKQKSKKDTASQELALTAPPVPAPEPVPEPEEELPEDLGEFEEDELAHIWEQLPGEPDFWFSRFRTFLLQVAPRNMLALYNKERLEKWRELKKPEESFQNSYNVPGSWKDAAKEWEWRERAKAYDEYINSSVDRTWLARQKVIREQEFNMANKLLERANEMLDWPLAFTKTEEKSPDGKLTIVNIYPAKWEFKDIPKMVEVASKLHRLASGMETDRKAANTTLSGPDGEPLKIEAPDSPPVVIVIPDNGRGAENTGYELLPENQSHIIDSTATPSPEPGARSQD